MEKEISPACQSSVSRRVITLQRKKEIIDAHESEKSCVNLSKQFDLPDSTIRTIVLNKNKILSALDEGCQAKRTKVYLRKYKKGMVSRMKAASSQHIELSGSLIKTCPVFEETIENKIVQSLVYVELKVQKIRESSCWLCESEIFRSIRELLDSNHENVLAHADQYPKELKWPLTIEEAIKVEESETRPRWLMLDMFLCIEMARTMPVFSQLDYKDQEGLLKHVILANAILQQAFYSWQMKSETFIMPNGFIITMLPKDDRLKGTMNRMKLLTCRAILEMSRIQMTVEEFVLLKAIIYSHSAIRGISERCRVLLEKESLRYSKTLMKHLQSRMGAAPGAKKYGDIIFFIGALFHGAQQLRQMYLYDHPVLGLYSNFSKQKRSTPVVLKIQDFPAVTTLLVPQESGQVRYVCQHSASLVECHFTRPDPFPDA